MMRNAFALNAIAAFRTVSALLCGCDTVTIVIRQVRRLLFFLAHHAAREQVIFAGRSNLFCAFAVAAAKVYFEVIMIVKRYFEAFIVLGTAAEVDFEIITTIMKSTSKYLFFYFL